MKFDVGEMAIDYNEIAKKDHLDNLSLEVRKLRDKLNDIHQNQEFQKVRAQTRAQAPPPTCLAGAPSAPCRGV